MDQQQDSSLIAKLADSQQKTIEHLLDQNAKLVNLCVSMYMPVPVVSVGKPAETTEDIEPNQALEGGMP